jgi:hypothetical protein
MPHREESRRSELFARFEQMGEVSVRLMDATPSLPPASEDIRYSRVWLAIRDAGKRDAREEATLSIARQASQSAFWANIIAITAIICSAAATISAVFIAARLVE